MHIAQRDACIQCRGDERVPQSVRSDRLGDPGTVRGPTDDPRCTMAVQPSAVGGQEQRAIVRRLGHVAVESHDAPVQDRARDELCQRRAAVKADRVEAMVLDAVRAYSATADAGGRASRRQQIRAADEAIARANADLDDAIRQLGELGLLGRAASQETLEKLTTALDDAHTARARLGDRGESNVIGPEDIDKLREPARRLAAWRRLITDTVQSVTVAPAMTADGRPSRLWDPRRIDIRFLDQHP